MRQFALETARLTSFIIFTHPRKQPAVGSHSISDFGLRNADLKRRRAKGKERRAKGKERRARGKEQRAKGEEQRAKGEGQYLLAMLKSWYISRIMMQVSPQSTPLEIERFIERAKQAYDERLAAKLEPEHTGEIVAIEPESGDYFLGADEIEAADNARAAGHDGPFYFLRVGSQYTHRLMTPRT